MRLRIAHSSVYRYDPPAAGVIQVLRLTPRNHEGQYVERWRIDVVPDARLAAHEDAFGNITHVFTADGPLEELRVEVDGEVETQNANGVVRGTVERFPPSLFLRDTALTQADGAIRDFAQKIRDTSGGVVLAELHGLLDRLFEDIARRRRHVTCASKCGRGFCAQARRAKGFGAYLHRRRAHARHPGPLCPRLLSQRRRQRRGGHQPRLGGSLCARSRLGRLRSVQRLLPDRRPCPRRHRARFARRRSGARHTPRASAPRLWRSPSRSISDAARDAAKDAIKSGPWGSANR